MGSDVCAVTILGAGPVGLALANDMLQAGVTVNLIAKDDLHKSAPGEATDSWVSALNPGSVDYLRTLDMFSHVPKGYSCPFEHMRVWDAGSRGAVHFSAADVGLPVLGTVVGNQCLRYALWCRLQQQAEQGVKLHLYTPAEALAIHQHQDKVQVELATGEYVAGQLLVGADGARSWVRDTLGMTWGQRNYGQYACVASIQSELPHEATAWQRFLPTGPVALLPLSAPHHSALVWTMPETEIEKRCQQPVQAFNQALTVALEQRLGALQCQSERRRFALQRGHATRYISDRVALIGDAAHTIHPLAGQGMNLGLADANALGTLLRTDFNTSAKSDLGHPHLLRQYQRQRQSINSFMQHSMTGFNTLFAQTAAPLRFIRGLGLNVVNKSRFLKHWFTSQASS